MITGSSVFIAVDRSKLERCGFDYLLFNQKTQRSPTRKYLDEILKNTFSNNSRVAQPYQDFQVGRFKRQTFKNNSFQILHPETRYPFTVKVSLETMFHFI